MNKIYSLVWNAAQSRWVIASELSSKQKKGGMRKTMLKGLAALLLTSAASSAFAGTCIQQDALGTGSVKGTGASEVTTCDAFSIAIGAGSGATSSSYSVAIGDAAHATGENAVALGRQTTASADETTATGVASSATQDGASSYGYFSQATGIKSTALGYNSNASQTNALALGNGANSSFANSIALGAGSVTTIGAESSYSAYRLSGSQASIGELGIGNSNGDRKITGLAAGTKNNDAVNVAQLKAVGDQVDQNTSDLVVMDGRVSNVEQVVNNLNAGGGVKYFHSNSTGSDSVATGQNAVAVGANAQAAGNNAIAMGNDASAQADGSVAVGAGASDNGRGAESYTGKYSDVANNTSGTVAVGNAATGETRSISNVADGMQDTDAVNVRQLDGAVAESKKYTDTSIANLSSSIGSVGGQMTETIQNVTNLQNGTDGMFQVNNTAQAAKPKPTGANSMAAGAGTSAAGKNATALGNGAMANHSNSVALGNGSMTDRDNSVSVGSAGNERQVTNVAAGTRETDAVNMGQLNNSMANSTSNANSYTDNRFNELSGDLDKQKKVLSAGIAGAMAMASLPQPYEPGANMMALGGASFHGESAISLGASHLSDNGRWVTKAQINTNTQHNVGWGVGVGFQF